MEFANKCRAMIKEGEGCVPYMYLDTRGYVTVGVGHMMRDKNAASELPFVHRDSGSKASADDIADEFETIKARPFGKSYSHRSFEAHTKLILTDAEIDALLDRRIAEFEAGLKRDFEGYDDYPEAARLGLIDMAFNLGNHGLVSKFPTFTEAARAKDWQTCAAECKRGGIGQRRNDETKKLFEEAFEDAI